METLKEPWNFCETPEEKCTMNYCDENGCQNRKRNLVKPKKSKAATFILGQIDKAIEKSNLEQQLEKLEAEKKELLAALDKSNKHLSILHDLIDNIHNNYCGLKDPIGDLINNALDKISNK